MSNTNAGAFTPEDLEIFGRVLTRLDEMLARLQSEPDDEAVRDSVIKRFELTYEHAHRTLFKYLISIEPSAQRVSGYDFQDLIRKGDQYGLLRTGWPEWKAYRDARNKTVHTYQEEIAIEVASQAREFAIEARSLFDHLTMRMVDNA